MKNKHRVSSNYQSLVKSSFCKKATALHLTFAIVSTLGGHNKLHNDEICSAWETKYISTAFRYTLTRRSEAQANSTMIRYKTGTQEVSSIGCVVMQRHYKAALLCNKHTSASQRWTLRRWWCAVLKPCCAAQCSIAPTAYHRSSMDNRMWHGNCNDKALWCTLNISNVQPD